jgi:hypothetical protein
MMVKHWSPWDNQLLRVLRGEFRLHSPALMFRPGPQGGVAVFHRERALGIWVATGRHTFSFTPKDIGQPGAGPCDIMEIIPMHYEMFSELLDMPGQSSA